MEAAMEGGQGALADILNQAKRNSLELERRRSSDVAVERRPSAAGRRSMEAGRLSAEARRTSVESRASAASGNTTVVKAPKGEARGKCPKGHPMFQRTGGKEIPTCSECFKRAGFDAYGCEQCNFYKCDDCMIGYARRKKKEEEEKRDEEDEKAKKASCFSCFGKHKTRSDGAGDAAKTVKQAGKHNKGASPIDV